MALRGQRILDARDGRTVSDSDIVVGVDGSAFSGRALDFAIGQAAALHGEVLAIHAWRPRAVITHEILRAQVDPETDELEAKFGLEAAVDEALTRAAADPPTIRTLLAEGDPTDVLLDHADEGRQIVVGTHGRGVAGRALLGSVGERLVLFADGPVTVVPPSDTSAPGDGRIVVGVDGAPASQAALAFAAAEARLHNAPLTVVFAYPSHHLYVHDAPRSDLAQAGRQLIDAMLEQLPDDTRHAIPAVEPLTIAADPSTALIEIAHRADQLVVGFGARSLRFGSVSRRCVHHAPCPTTIVKP